VRASVVCKRWPHLPRQKGQGGQARGSSNAGRGALRGNGALRAAGDALQRGDEVRRAPVSLANLAGRCVAELAREAHAAPAQPEPHTEAGERLPERASAMPSACFCASRSLVTAEPTRKYKHTRA